MTAYPTTEDEVREHAGKVLGFDKIDPSITKAGVGQITTLKQLGFNSKGAALKPDGWYLPRDRGLPAIVLETKAHDSIAIDSPALKTQVERYCNVNRYGRTSTASLSTCLTNFSPPSTTLIDSWINLLIKSESMS